MKNKSENAKTKKPGKIRKEMLDKVTKRETKDLGDPRGSRAPQNGPRTTDVTEKGDKRRPK